MGLFAIATYSYNGSTTACSAGVMYEPLETLKTIDDEQTPPGPLSVVSNYI